MELHPIGRNGELPLSVPNSEYLEMVVEMTVSHYARVGFKPPWTSYIAVAGAEPIGTCAFKSSPSDGRVEIAYGTVPEFQGQGVATKMARSLVDIAHEQDEKIVVFAQTLPEENASTSILRRLGFRLAGSVEHPEDGTVWEWELS